MMNTQPEKVGELFFLLHLGEIQFSGYGLTVERRSARRLVGILMVDRPQPVSQQWLAEVEWRYGRYELYPMTQSGERGIACQMWIADASLVYVKKLPGAFTRLLQEALFPLLTFPPNPQLDVQWDGEMRLWKSTFHGEEPLTGSANSKRQRQVHRFALGTVVSTPGAMMALEESGQVPQEFLHRHSAGDWGDLDEHDRQANERALREGGRLLSAYATKQGIRIWVITEHDHSVTTLLTPSEY
jgi:hypothetical protein